MKQEWRTYICECGRKCGRSVYIKNTDYERLYPHGNVMTLSCARELGYTVVESLPLDTAVAAVRSKR